MSYGRKIVAVLLSSAERKQVLILSYYCGSLPAEANCVLADNLILHSSRRYARLRSKSMMCENLLMAQFEREEGKEVVPCHCGAKTCCGRLN